MAVLLAGAGVGGTDPAAAAVAGARRLAGGRGRGLRLAGGALPGVGLRAVAAASRRSCSCSRCAAFGRAATAVLLVVLGLPAIALLAGLHLTEAWFLVRDARGFTQGRYLLPLLPLAGAGRRRGAGKRAGPRARRGARRGPGPARGRPARVAGHRRRAVLCVGAAARRRSSPSRSRRSPRARWPPRAHTSDVATAVGLPAVNATTPLAPGDDGLPARHRHAGGLHPRPARRAAGRRRRAAAGGLRAPGRPPRRAPGAWRAAMRRGRSRRASAPCRPAGAWTSACAPRATAPLVLLGSTAPGAREVYDPLRGALFAVVLLRPEPVLDARPGARDGRAGGALQAGRAGAAVGAARGGRARAAAPAPRRPARRGPGLAARPPRREAHPEHAGARHVARLVGGRDPDRGHRRAAPQRPPHRFPARDRQGQPPAPAGGDASRAHGPEPDHARAAGRPAGRILIAPVARRSQASSQPAVIRMPLRPDCLRAPRSLSLGAIVSASAGRRGRRPAAGAAPGRGG